MATSTVTRASRDYLIREEAANAATHALGLAGAVVGAAVVLAVAVRHGTAAQVVACAIYAVTLVAAFAASTLSHALYDPRRRRAMRVADQAIIFLFIAGSWTPYAVTWLARTPWWTVHAAVWAIAVVGFVSKTIFTHRVRVGTVSAGMYLIQGWIPMLTVPALIASAPTGAWAWLLAGGTCYTLGIAFFALDHRYRYFHAAWHVMVNAGSACHYLGILLYCTAPPTGL